jgi:glycosyltransferase involved in cell wall biosynthesis
MTPRVSIVIPCYNEAGHIASLLDALREQTCHAAELVVADCHSTDGTLDVLASYPYRSLLPPVTVVTCERRSTPMALNAGIRAAAGDVIVRLDGHSRPDPEYVRRSVELLESPNAGVVGGVWQVQPGGDGSTAAAIALAVTHPFGAGDALYRTGRGLTEARDVDTVPFGCFRRSLWERLGGFDEHFLVNQDYEFNYRVRKAGWRVVLDPRIRAAYIARPDIPRLGHQYFRYGWWKAETLKRHPSSLRWRQAVPAGFVASVLGLGAASAWDARALLPLSIIVLSYAAAATAASAQAARRARRWNLLPLLAVVFAVVHLAWGFGLLTNLLTLGRWPASARALARGRSPEEPAGSSRPVASGSPHGR